MSSLSEVKTREMPVSSSIITNDIGPSIEDLIKAIDATIKPFGDGDLLSGTVVKIEQDEVLVDVGYKAEGVIPAKELSIRTDASPSELVSVGEKIEAVVLQKEDKEGRLVLSRKRANYEKTWSRIEEARRNGEEVKGKVIEVVKGGLIVDIGLRGFLPASLVETRRVRDLEQFIGQEVECKVIELDRNRNNVVLSRRAHIEQTSAGNRKVFMENLKVGERRKGIISSVVPFGAFVDLGGVDGLIHVSEISWQHVTNPADVVEAGQEVEVEIISVESDRDRVSLSLKATQEDPWQKFANSHQVGDVVPGVVTKVVPFGAFIELAEMTEGLAHISELSDAHVDKADQVVATGQEVQARILELDGDRRRISLSLKQAVDAYAMAFADYKPLVATQEPAQEATVEPATAVSEPAEPEPEPEFQREADGEESLESIVEEMKRERA